jgi:hypothetical protein
VKGGKLKPFSALPMGLEYSSGISPLRLRVAADNAAIQTEPTKANAPKRKRRWVQFSLRTLLIVTLICAIASAWVARRMKQKREERVVVEEILKHRLAAKALVGVESTGSPTLEPTLTTAAGSDSESPAPPRLSSARSCRPSIALLSARHEYRRG